MPHRTTADAPGPRLSSTARAPVPARRGPHGRPRRSVSADGSPHRLGEGPAMSRVVIPPGSDTISASRSSRWRPRFGASIDVNVPARSRGSARSASPTSVATVFGLVALRGVGNSVASDPALIAEVLGRFRVSRPRSRSAGRMPSNRRRCSNSWRTRPPAPARLPVDEGPTSQHRHHGSGLARRGAARLPTTQHPHVPQDLRYPTGRRRPLGAGDRRVLRPQAPADDPGTSIYPANTGWARAAAEFRRMFGVSSDPPDRARAASSASFSGSRGRRGSNRRRRDSGLAGLWAANELERVAGQVSPVKEETAPSYGATRSRCSR